MTNIGAQVFAIDAQTNVYGNAGGAVIQLNSAGLALQTNSFCPLPGLAQRDSAGNIYFAGSFPLPCQFCSVTPVDFGGVTLSNGLFFVAKYSPSGVLIWAKEFGPQFNSGIRSVAATDSQIDSAGNCYVAFVYAPSTHYFYSQMVRFDAFGTLSWSTDLPNNSWLPETITGSVKFGRPGQTNGYAAIYIPFYLGPPVEALWTFDAGGTATAVGSWAFSGGAWVYAHTVGNSLNEIYNVESGSLTKRSVSGTVLVSVPIGIQWTVGPDQYGGVHVGDDSGSLSRYDSDCNPVWTLNLSSPVNAMILDGYGNRFISLADGTVARLGAETLSMPSITMPPQNQTALAGSDVVIGVTAAGFSPLRYSWLFNNAPLPDATNATLALSSVTSANAGIYAVVVTNVSGSITSTPALLRVKLVEIYSGDQPLTNGNYFYSTPVVLTVRSAFANGTLFYTLDGSTPSFNSILYSGPFTLSNSATVRAIGYSADFTQSEEADPVYATVLTQHTLTSLSSGGGTVALNPPGGTYASTNTVTVTAIPNSGWSFLYWLDDASGTNSTINVTMEHDKSVQAVFGTTLSTTVVGNGQIQLEPPGGIYPYGTVVRLTGIPQPGNYFGFWGNAATGNENPLYFTLTNPSPTVSSIFGALSSGQAALTVLINGQGQVTVNPRANVYASGAIVTISATADRGQTFLNWSGDASGTQNPLTLTMNLSKTITANFSEHANLRLNRAAGEGLSAAGFRFTIISAPESVWQVFGSTNLSTWENLGVVTNFVGEVQFTDPEAINHGSRFYKVLPWP